ATSGTDGNADGRRRLMAQAERIFGVREVTRLLGLTPKRAAQLRRLGVLSAGGGCTFRALVAIRAASALLDSGATVRQIRQALDALRRQEPGLGSPLAETRLVVAGSRALARGYAAACNSLGLLHHRMGQYTEAQEAYEAALRAQPTCAEAAYNLGSLCEDLGELPASIRFYLRALELSPDYPDAHFNLAG